MQSTSLTCWFQAIWNGLHVLVFTRALHLLTPVSFPGIQFSLQIFAFSPNSTGTSLHCENFLTLDIDHNTHTFLLMSLPPCTPIEVWGHPCSSGIPSIQPKEDVQQLFLSEWVKVNLRSWVLFLMQQLLRSFYPRSATSLSPMQPPRLAKDIWGEGLKTFWFYKYLACYFLLLLFLSTDLRWASQAVSNCQRLWNPWIHALSQGEGWHI